MSITRPFELIDILKFNQVNADSWTATVRWMKRLDDCDPTTDGQYHNGYYASYLAQWPDFCVVTEGAFDDSIKSYSAQRISQPLALPDE